MARIAKSLDTLRSQVNAAYPGRGKSSDGWIGDAAHQARKSDHNPNSAGVVQALDITHDPANGFDSYKFADHLVDTWDHRLKYIISNRRYAESKGKWQPYNGANPHTGHVHVSVSDSASLYDDPAQWNIGATMEPTLKKGASGPNVTSVQTLLTARGFPVEIDGFFGANTETAVKAFQESRDIDPDGIVGPDTWKELKLAAQPEPEPEPSTVDIVIKATGPVKITVNGQVINITPEPEPEPSAFENITATVFNDAQGAYGPLNPANKYVAFPWRIEGNRPSVRVTSRDTGKSDIGDVGDVGPWMIDDNYAAKGARPIAETCFKNKTPLPSGPNAGKIPTNDAGIDLSPALAKAIGLDGKGKVDWEFI